MSVSPDVQPRAFGRRVLLAGVLGGAVVAAGCSLRAKPPPPTYSSLTQESPFYIAHRGGGGNWPELTAYAYEQASRLPGLHAMEISVCQTSDGVLVCSHDRTTTRATGVPYVIAEQTWQTLSTLQVSAAHTTDPAQPGRPFTRFDEVVDAYADRFVLFVEPKDSRASPALLDKMSGLRQPERVVWKQPINSQLFATAKQAGFATWGYVLDEPAHTGDNLARLAASPDVDMLGAPAAESDAFVQAVVAAAGSNGKLTTMWEIRSVADRDRALALGCRGMMTSDLLEVLPAAS